MLENLNNALLLENGCQCLILSLETQSHHAVPFFKINGGRRVVRLDSTYSRLYFWRRVEIVASHFQQLLRTS